MEFAPTTTALAALGSDAALGAAQSALEQADLVIALPFCASMAQ